jgi:hypothetical protein
MNRSESISNFAAAMALAQSEMGTAAKDSKNPYFKSTYADLNSIREASLPALNKNGISVLQPTTVIDGKTYIETILLHSSGEFLSGLTEVVVAKQNDPQATGSGISYARRYGMQSMLNIGAEDSDAEGAMNRPAKSTPTIATTTAEVKTTVTSAVNTSPPSRGSFKRNPAVVQEEL